MNTSTQATPGHHDQAMSNEDSIMTTDAKISDINPSQINAADSDAPPDQVTPDEAKGQAISQSASTPAKHVLRTGMLFMALACIALGWATMRYGGFSSSFLWLGILLGLLCYALSFVPTGFDGWMLRRPLLFVPYALIWARRNLLTTALVLVAIVGAWGLAGDGPSDDVSAVAGQGIAQSLPRPIILVEAPLRESASLKIIGKEGTGPGEVREPRGVAVARDGRVYVADSANKRVQIFAPDGKFLTEILGGEEAFDFPGAVAINNKNEVLVLDSNKQWVYFFSADGKALKRIGGPTLGFYFPRGLGLDAADNVYIADTGGSRVVKLSPNGDRLQVIGRRGTGRGEIMEPTAVVVDREGIIYVADPTNRRMVLFNAGGEFLREFAIRPASTVDGPKLAIEDEGTILITSPASHVIHRYDKNTGIIAEFGGEGSAPGRLRVPTGIAIYNKTVWVTETAAHRVQQLELK